MYEYGHGGNAAFEDGKAGVIDLSANINPLGMPEGVKEAIINEIAGCGRYPDNSSGSLRLKIAEYENVRPDNIFCGNGASDIIFRLPRAVRAKRVMIAAPTFADYERSALSAGSEVIRYKLSDSNGFILDGDFITAVQREKPDLVSVCNPNNPTGVLVKPELIGALLYCCREIGSFVMIDECFLDFTEWAGGYTSKNYLQKYNNLVILKAFTKIFGLPGIRLGYCLCADEGLAQSLRFHGPDWPVSNLAQAAGIAALIDADSFVKQTVDYVTAERRTLEKELFRLGFRTFGSKANYLFIQNPYPVDLRAELDKKGVRIRSCGNFHGLNASYYRIAVSTSENNAALLAAITEVVKYMNRAEGFHQTTERI